MVTRTIKIKTKTEKKTISTYLSSLLLAFSPTKLQAAWWGPTRPLWTKLVLVWDVQLWIGTREISSSRGRKLFMCVELKAGEHVTLTKVRTFRFFVCFIPDVGFVFSFIRSQEANHLFTHT
jgi:hypothetical protein